MLTAVKSYLNWNCDSGRKLQSAPTLVQCPRHAIADGVGNVMVSEGGDERRSVQFLPGRRLNVEGEDDGSEDLVQASRLVQGVTNLSQPEWMVDPPFYREYHRSYLNTSRAICCLLHVDRCASTTVRADS
jgi:hypothetical protein